MLIVLSSLLFLISVDHCFGSDDKDTCSPFNSDIESSSHSCGDSDTDDDESVEHTLAFKCIGAAHEKPRQKFLEVAERKLHREQCEVKVKLRHEPENEKDRNAIAIDMDHGTGWFHVGYIASELTQYLHPLILDGKIVNTCSAYLFQSLFCTDEILPINYNNKKRAMGKICHNQMPKCSMKSFLLIYVQPQS